MKQGSNNIIIALLWCWLGAARSDRPDLTSAQPGLIYVWSSPAAAEFPAWAADAVRSTALADKQTHVYVFCATSACVNACSDLLIANVVVHRLRVRFLVTAGNPLGRWFSRHPANKLQSGAAFPSFFDTAARLSILYQLGGVLLNWNVRLKQPCAAFTGCELLGDSYVASAAKRSPAVADAMARFLVDFNASTWNTSSAPQWASSCPLQQAQAVQALQQCMEATSNGAPQPSAHFFVLWLDDRIRAMHRIGLKGASLGDEVQGVAAVQWLPYVDTRVERDDLAFKRHIAERPVYGNITGFMNAWYGCASTTLPPHYNLNPIMVSVHIEKSIHRMWTKGSVLAYMKAREPIGARDDVTYHFLQSIGINTFFSGCLTTTMQRHMAAAEKPKCDVLLVDVLAGVENHLPRDLVTCHTSPQQLHGSEDKFNGHIRYRRAYELLDTYSAAPVIVTSRLHAALPSMSMGVPVVLVLGSKMPGGGGSKSDGNQRFSGLQGLVHSIELNETYDGREFFASFPWRTPLPNPGADLVAENRCKIFRYVHERYSGLVDSIITFDVDGIFDSCK